MDDGRTDCDDARLRRHARRYGADDADARRRFCQGGNARGAAAGLSHFRAHARIVAALPSRAQDRRPDARARARPQRHRDDRAHGHPATRADHHRTDADLHRVVVAVRLALCRRHRHHRRALSGLDILRHRVAHRHSPQDERQRYRRECEGNRLAAELRDGEILLGRRPRVRTLRPRNGALRRRPQPRPIRRSRCSMPGRRSFSLRALPPPW